MGGILEESETQSISGYPLLMKIPILKYLFGQEDKQLRENEIVFAIIPHIVRAQDVTEQNLRLVDVGTGSSIGLRHRDPIKPDSPPSVAAPAPQGGRPQPGHSHAPAPARNSQGQPGGERPAASPPRAAASADPCPYGQHTIGQENGIVVCAFD